MTSYGEAGVSLAKAEEVAERLRAAVESTRTERVEGSLGAFAGLFALDDDRLLAATTDGIGTKIVLARRAGRLFDAGADLAAHCANDLLTVGAEPLFFLDYVAAGTLDLEEVASWSRGRRRSAATPAAPSSAARRPSSRASIARTSSTSQGRWSGSCAAPTWWTARAAGPETPSSAFPRTGCTRTASRSSAASSATTTSMPTFSSRPTRLYLEDVRRLRATCDVRALAHVTGGGIAGNLPRVLPAGLGARLDPGSWERPPVYGWLDERGVPEDEQRRVFNLGVGFCAVVSAADAERAGLPVIGRLEEGVDGVAWADAR